MVGTCIAQPTRLSAKIQFRTFQHTRNIGIVRCQITQPTDKGIRRSEEARWYPCHSLALCCTHELYMCQSAGMILLMEGIVIKFPGKTTTKRNKTVGRPVGVVCTSRRFSRPTNNCGKPGAHGCERGDSWVHMTCTKGDRATTTACFVQARISANGYTLHNPTQRSTAMCTCITPSGVAISHMYLSYTYGLLAQRATRRLVVG